MTNFSMQETQRVLVECKNSPYCNQPYVKEACRQLFWARDEIVNLRRQVTELEQKVVESNHRNLDLQYIIDGQAGQIAKLTEEADCTEIYEALEDVGIPMGDGEQPQDIITAIGILGRQVATLKAALIEERARALWFNGTDPSNSPNLDWKTPPNDVSKSVRWLWEVPAKKQLAKEYPEIFAVNKRLQEIE